MKNRFKVGDIVRARRGVKLPGHYFVTNCDMIRGEVVETDLERNNIEIRVLEHKLYPTLHGCTYLVDAEYFELIEPETIVIYRKGNEVYALDKQSGKKVVAKCHPDDEFDFNKGAEIAFNRLLGEEPKKGEARFYNGKIICIKNAPGNESVYTVGKIYEVVDGKFNCDNGMQFPFGNGISSFDEFNVFSCSEWLEVVE